MTINKRRDIRTFVISILFGVIAAYVLTALLYGTWYPTAFMVVIGRFVMMLGLSRLCYLLLTNIRFPRKG